MFITETFKQFCKEMHDEDKKLRNNKNYDYMQEVYANTELFDLSKLEDESNGSVDAVVKIAEEISTVNFKELKEISLPFQNMFINGEGYGTFVREYEPYLLTGSFFLTDVEIKGSRGYHVNIPFTLNLEKGCLTVDTEVLLGAVACMTNFKLNQKGLVEEIKKFFATLSVSLYKGVLILNSLPKYSVITDTKQRTEYYPRKQCSTIKVTNRPIYYVLDKKVQDIKQVSFIKALGKLEFSHSFHVRGHWRKLSNPKTIGKDRNGEYKITTGYTWVKDCVKGEGELVKRVRILR